MRKRIQLAIFAAIVTAIVLGSLMPFPAKAWMGTPYRDVVIWMPGRLFHLNMHRFLHVAAFGMAALTALSLTPAWPKRILMMLAVCALALFSEAGEAALYHNRMEWPDMVDDALGIATALLLSAAWRLRAGTANPATSGR